MENRIGAGSEKAVAYARSACQDALSTTRQIGAIRRYAEAHGLTLVDEYIEYASGLSFDGRPQLQEMMRRVLEPDSGVSSIIVTDLSRLTRDFSQAQSVLKQLGQRGVRLESILQRSGQPSVALV